MSALRSRHPFSTGRNVRLLVCLASVALTGCGSDGPMDSADYGNLLNSPAGLILVAQEHPTGWGRPDCLVCHEVRNMHVVNRTGLPDCTPAVQDACIDLPGIRAIINSEGEASCAQCHGDNGVNP
jgi:hypothetical protein